MKNNSISQFKSFTRLTYSKLAICSCIFTLMAGGLLLKTWPSETTQNSTIAANHAGCGDLHHQDEADFLFHDLNPFQQQIMKQLINQSSDPEHPAVCWHPDTDQQTIENFHKKNKATAENSLAISDPDKYQLGSRWTTTATNGGGLGQGDPTTLTWSFVPDGTTIINGCGVPGESTDPSDRIAFLDGGF